MKISGDVLSHLPDPGGGEHGLDLHPCGARGRDFLFAGLCDEKEVEAGRMVYLQVEDFEIGIWKQLLYHRDKWVSPQLGAVLQYCARKEFHGGE